MTVNKVILIGNLGADPESRTAGTGTVVTKLRIATSERVKSREGQWEDHTEWHRVVCFGRTAENVARFLRKGRQVFIEGRLRTNKWQDRDGNDRWTTEIIADQVRFLSRSDSGGGGYSGGGEGGGYSGGSGGGYSGGSGGGGGGYSGDSGGGGSTDGGGGSTGGGGYGGGGGGGGGSPDDDIPF